MAGIALKIGISAGLLLLILAFGRVLHTTGRPYLRGLFAGHIVTTAALAIYLIYIFLLFSETSNTAPGLEGLIISGLISLLILLLTGLFLSFERYLILSLWLHRLATLGFIISSVIILWRIFST